MPFLFKTVLFASIFLSMAAIAEQGKFRFSVSGAMKTDTSSAAVESRYYNDFGGMHDASGNLKNKMTAEKTNDFVPVLRAGMIFPTSSNMAMAFNLVAELGSVATELKSKSFEFPNPNNRPDILRDYKLLTTITPKSHYGIEVEPVLRLSTNWDGFIRGGFHKLDAEISNDASYNSGNLSGPIFANKPVSKKTFYGISIGAGFLYRFSQRIFLTFYGQILKYEAQKVDAQHLLSTGDEIGLTSTQDITPGDNRGELGLGFQF